MEIRTERLTLRTWQADDAAALYALASEPEIGEKCGWVPHSSAEYSAMVIDSSLQNDEVYAIVLSENNTIIGSVSIKLDGDSDLSNWEDEGKIGVWIGKPYWKKGYATEACAALLDHVFYDLDLSKIWAGHYHGNLASRKLQQGLGFEQERTEEEYLIKHLKRMTKLHVFSLTREKWQALHPYPQKLEN